MGNRICNWKNVYLQNENTMCSNIKRLLRIIEKLREKRGIVKFGKEFECTDSVKPMACKKICTVN